MFCVLVELAARSEGVMTTAKAISESGTRHHAQRARDRVHGTVVRRRSGERVGTIQRLMIDKVSGNVAYAILRFGGFFGVGDKHLPIPWERLKFDTTRQAYLVSLTDKELANAPSYASDADFDWGDRKSEGALHSYYGTRAHWGL